MLLINIANR